VSKKFKLLGILLIISLLAVPIVGCGLTLTIWEPEDGATLTESPVTVSGAVSNPEATVTVNDVEVGRDWQFTTDVELTEGENTITVVATLGEETVTKAVTVTYRPSE